MKNVHRVIKFSQKASLRPCTDMNNVLRENVKNDFEKKFKLMNNAFFGKTLENGRNHRDIKLIATETRGNYLVLDVEIKLSCNKIIS